jgi:serine phosphatase RsbU (regulator of sigma subunit)/CHASE3 domain sensor protein
METRVPPRRGRAGTLWVPRLLIAGYVVVLILVLGAVLPSLLSTRHTLDRLRQHYDPAAVAVDDLLTAALNQETGVRGYALTGRPAFLEPFDQGTDQFDRAHRALEDSTLGSMARRQLSLTIARYEDWRRYATEVNADIARGDMPAARALVASGTGKRQFDRFRTAQSDLRETIDHRVVQSRDDLRDAANRSLVALVLAVAVGVLLVAAMWVWWRIAGRQHAEAERALADSGVLTQAVIDATTDSIFAKDAEGNHIIANRARGAALNRGDADVSVIGRSVDSFVEPGLAARIRIDDAAIVADGQERQVDEILQQPDGPHVFLTTKSPLHDASGRVIGVVGVARDVTEERALRADRERLYRVEHELATTLQQAMLGRNSLEDDDRLEICAKYQPAVTQMSVGGDWYDVVALTDGAVGLIAGDVVGHGIDSATVMGQLRSALAALAVSGRGPAAALEALDEFAFTIPGARSATCVYAIVDPDRERLTYSCAGHMPPVLLEPDGAAQMLDHAQDPPLAATQRGRPRRTTTVEFPVGSMLLLYTDGLIERRSESIDHGFDRLVAEVDTRRDLAMAALCDELIAALLSGQNQRDDVAIVAARLLRATGSTRVETDAGDAQADAPARALPAEPNARILRSITP